MYYSLSTAKLMAQLTEAQKEFKPIAKTKTGQEGNRKFKYADLADVVSMVLPILNSKGIFLSQPIIQSEGVTRQTTRLQYQDEYIQSDGIALPSDAPGKNLGISVTYARRIDLNGLLGLAPDEDVDAPDLTPTPTKSTLQEVRKGVVNKITDADLPPEMFGEVSVTPKSDTIAPDLRQAAIEMENFKPLSEARNTEIQARLKELVSSKTLDRKKLALFLDREHGGKKSIDVSADRWDITMSKIETAVAAGQEEIKNLLKAS